MVREREPALVLIPDEIGINALKFIASHQDLIDRFIDITGFDPSNLRQLATQPAFFVAVLDFFLAHEPDLLDLASQLYLPPAAIGKARNVLAREAGVEIIELPA